jgi:hypothetical protein
VPDKRLKEGWIKQIYLRPTGKWDVIFVSNHFYQIKPKLILIYVLDQFNW